MRKSAYTAGPASIIMVLGGLFYIVPIVTPPSSGRTAPAVCTPPELFILLFSHLFHYFAISIYSACRFWYNFWYN